MTDMATVSSMATVQCGVARADGRLWATADTLHFTPFNTLLGLGPYQIDIVDVIKVEQCLGKGAGLLPLTTQAIQITLKSNQTFKFILSEPESWVRWFNSIDC
ncbi:MULTISPECIES: hypothetical protein [Pseudoalteromonas]|uniref:hypothetical protein n=1 Tax=Pseudoalteromonas TaxID=53246 RepID=UPI0015742E11|nr:MULTISPECIES: hypothetical protein [Pseudoalteromonas]MBR8845740.1 hypothetical protein [Pseudoalteromonas sp. JC3]NSY35945.1 hypothetical protein [Pseudoalteromonas sp. JC28]QUI70152.1 hypothetical protein GSF13_10405 [Pseudoalteromonas sp. M8]UDM62450.1 hypothetical protein KIJ96_04090 [Pseudoalteromonas piscicida]WJE09849.1 hypothetical protein QSH61_05155 [Pseudoalteromonas sp. JC3]